MGRPPLRLGRPKGRPQAPFQPSHENRYPFTNWSTFAPPKWSKFTPPLTEALSVQFGEAEVRFGKRGVYRLDASTGEPFRLKVFDGKAAVSANGSKHKVKALPGF